jgi:hypothetical protein
MKTSTEKKERDYLEVLEHMISLSQTPETPYGYFVALFRKQQNELNDLRADVAVLKARDDEPMNMTEVLEKIY